MRSSGQARPETPPSVTLTSLGRAFGSSRHSQRPLWSGRVFQGAAFRARAARRQGWRRDMWILWFVFMVGCWAWFDGRAGRICRLPLGSVEFVGLQARGILGWDTGFLVSCLPFRGVKLRPEGSRHFGLQRRRTRFDVGGGSSHDGSGVGFPSL